MKNPDRVRFSFQPTVLVGALNSGPTLDPIGTVELHPGEKRLIPLNFQDVDGDRIEFSLSSPVRLSGVTLTRNNELLFQPRSEDVGTYEFSVLANDGAITISQAVQYRVLEAAQGETNISGVIQNTAREPLTGVRVTYGEHEAITDAFGMFTMSAATPPPDNTLRIHGEAIEGEVTYPFIAEKLPLVLGHELIEGANNEIIRPIYLPPIDMSSATTIDPAQDTMVTSTNLEHAALFVAAGMLENPAGEPFTGQLSITEVPRDLTPAALPENLIPDTVVTIQPGEMQFLQPAPLNLPNRAGYEPGTVMDLWSINPESGEFEKVGDMLVSADGTTIETVTGGVMTISWHFAAPAPPTPEPLQKDPKECSCPSPDSPGTSRYELRTGNVTESHDLVSYQSVGESRGLRLVYDSARVDSRPILSVQYEDVPSQGDQLRLAVRGEICVGNSTVAIPGSAPGLYGLDGGFHFWQLPAGGGDLSGALQADLSTLPSGRYPYRLDSGLMQLNDDMQAFGTLASTESFVVHVNTLDSDFGAGWGLAGHQQIIVNDDQTVLLVDGNGEEAVFHPTLDANRFDSPTGDFSRLERTPEGFRRTLKDGTVYAFNGNNLLASVIDRNQREIRYVYNEGRLAGIIDPVGLETRFEYENGKVVRIIDPANRVTQFRHDANGDLIQIIDPDQTNRSWDYDSRHLLTGETTKRGFREATTYDAFGRVSRGIRADGSEIGLRPAEIAGLDPTGQTLNFETAPEAHSRPRDSRYVHADGALEITRFDEFGQVLETNTIEGMQTQVNRNARNLITSVVSPRGFTDVFEYDDRGNVIRRADEIVLGGGSRPLFAGEFVRVVTVHDPG